MQKIGVDHSAIPTTMVVFGVTGDLAKRKLLPALFDLYQKNLLPKSFACIGFSRRLFTDKDFRLFVRSILEQRKSPSLRAIKTFLPRLSYVQGVFEDPQSYTNLSQALGEIDNAAGFCTNKLFHLAVPPALYKDVFRNFAASGLTIPCGSDQGWTRLLVEKPFGNDLETARKLNEQLGKLFREEQIFRIDHYLAKEALQNILSFRFSNALFEPLWNRDHIEKVEIKLLETIGVEQRGAFYDKTGSLRDVGQNHLLQMLALVAMENPGVMEAGAIRQQRSRVLQALRPIVVDRRSHSVTKGQYEGFLREPSVAPHSRTETYVRICAYIDNVRWRGVPFLLESGKKLHEAKTEITIFFRQQSCLCPPGSAEPHQNTLTFRIQPEEGITIRFWAKRPGFDFALEQKIISFLYKDSAKSVWLPDAYERVLVDCIRGDQTLFTSQEEIHASWKFITPILERWGILPLYHYKQGSQGPTIQD